MQIESKRAKRAKENETELTDRQTETDLGGEAPVQNTETGRIIISKLGE